MGLQLNLKTIDEALERNPALLIVARRDVVPFLEALRFGWPGFPLLPTLEIPPDAYMRGVRVVSANIEHTVTMDWDMTIRRIF